MFHMVLNILQNVFDGRYFFADGLPESSRRGLPVPDLSSKLSKAANLALKGHADGKESCGPELASQVYVCEGKIYLVPPFAMVFLRSALII